jgi:hypothetical protein
MRTKLPTCGGVAVLRIGKKHEEEEEEVAEVMVVALVVADSNGAENSVGLPTLYLSFRNTTRAIANVSLRPAHSATPPLTSSSSFD